MVWVQHFKVNDTRIISLNRQQYLLYTIVSSSAFPQRPAIVVYKQGFYTEPIFHNQLHCDFKKAYFHDTNAIDSLH